MSKIIAVVKFNAGEAFVFEKKPNYKYTKYNGLIIGIDDFFIETYIYENPGEYSKAFAGRKFDLQLTDGTVEHCWGQWWWSGSGQAEEIIGHKIISLTHNDIVSLKKCYVFCGAYGVKEELDKLRKEYIGKVYDYREYEKIIKEGL